MDSGRDEAADALRRALAAADEGLRALSAIEQVQERLGPGIETMIVDRDAWNAASAGYREAQRQLFHARGCLEEVLDQVLRGQAPEARARAGIDELVRLYSQTQSALDEATGLAKRAYEVLRPQIMEYYLAHATRRPRWLETWPRDSDAASDALGRLANNLDANLVDQLDITLARFRWEVGWPQQQMAEVVGLSQPSVAARLGRIEGLLNLEVGLEHVREQARHEEFNIDTVRLRSSRDPRGATAEVVLQTHNIQVQLELLVAAGESGMPRRGAMAERGLALDYFRTVRSKAGYRAREGVVQAVGVYFRDTGTVGYYTATEFSEHLGRLGRAPAGMWLDTLQQALAPAWNLQELLARARGDGGEQGVG